MTDVPIVLSVAGSDPSGGAGVQADLRTIALHGLHGGAVVTAVTVQNTHGVLRVEPVDAELVAAQLAALLEDLRPAAIKLGMLGTSAVAVAVARLLARLPDVPVIVDPVLVSSSGAPLLRGDVGAYREHLFARATLITPNHDEAAALLGLSAAFVAADPEAAAVALGREVPTLLTGGHAASAPVDLLATDRVRRYEGARIHATSSHGTGCLLSTSIACAMARGAALPEAVAHAKACVEDGLRHALRTGVRLENPPAP